MHNEVIISYFEGNRFIGQSRTECGTVDVAGSQYHAYWPDTAYFCPTCGELWGRCIKDFQFNYCPYYTGTRWEVETRHCVAHGDGAFLADDRFLEGTYDKALLTRELLVLIERSNNC